MKCWYIVNQCVTQGSFCFSAGISAQLSVSPFHRRLFGFLYFVSLNELWTDVVVSESNQQMGPSWPHLTKDYTSGDGIVENVCSLMQPALVSTCTVEKGEEAREETALSCWGVRAWVCSFFQLISQTKWLSDGRSEKWQWDLVQVLHKPDLGNLGAA